MAASPSSNNDGDAQRTSSLNFQGFLDRFHGWDHLSTPHSSVPNAASEKDLGNQYFKQKQFNQAIDCYSRSIAFSPSAVAFANRAMAYLKINRFDAAEADCTDALNLDDRYVKAYSRRATARKHLGKLHQAMQDAEFAVSLEPNTQELRKQYDEIKALCSKCSEVKARESPLVSMQKSDVAKDASKKESVAAVSNQRNGKKESVEKLASRAISHFSVNNSKNITAPKSAYEFEVSWRALSDDCQMQAQLLKMISPSSLPQIFKNSLSASILVDIVKCISIFFRDDTELATSILENLVKVPRFDMICMCLSPFDRREVRRIWEEVFCAEGLAMHQMETVRKLGSKYMRE